MEGGIVAVIKELAVVEQEKPKPTWREEHCPGCVYYASCQMHWVKHPGDSNKKCYMLRVKL